MKKALLATFIIAISFTAFLHREGLLSVVQDLEKESVSMPITTALLLIALKAVSAPLGFPGTPLTLLSGSLFGKLLGTVIALIGNTLGASFAFLLSRYILRDFIREKFELRYPRIKEYDQKIEQKALATVIALRLIPLFPFNALNFMLGLTSIPFGKYVIGSFIGMIPGTFAFAYFGESLRMLSPVNIALAIMGIVLLTYLGKLYARKFS